MVANFSIENDGNSFTQSSQPDDAAREPVIGRKSVSVREPASTERPSLTRGESFKRQSMMNRRQSSFRKSSDTHSTPIKMISKEMKENWKALRETFRITSRLFKLSRVITKRTFTRVNHNPPKELNLSDMLDQSYQYQFQKVYFTVMIRRLILCLIDLDSLKPSWQRHQEAQISFKK